jgi:hypothetical protein
MKPRVCRQRACGRSLPPVPTKNPSAYLSKVQDYLANVSLRIAPDPCTTRYSCPHNRGRENTDRFTSAIEHFLLVLNFLQLADVASWQIFSAYSCNCTNAVNRVEGPMGWFSSSLCKRDLPVRLALALSTMFAGWIRIGNRVIRSVVTKRRKRKASGQLCWNREFLEIRCCRARHIFLRRTPPAGCRAEIFPCMSR